jgi:CO/xanthine dehydrogenase FAD-binding subunit
MKRAVRSEASVAAASLIDPKVLTISAIDPSCRQRLVVADRLEARFVDLLADHLGQFLFAAAPYGDLAAALLALDAIVDVQGAYGGVQQMPIEQFLQSRDRATGLVTSVTVPRPVSPDAFRFRKVSRVKPKGVSVLSIAAHLPLAGGRLSDVRVAYGAMAPTSIRARAVERALEGRSLDAAGIAPALAAAAEGTSPPTDALASAWYRREVLPVHLRRLLLAETG